MFKPYMITANEPQKCTVSGLRPSVHSKPVALSLNATAHRVYVTESIRNGYQRKVIFYFEAGLLVKPKPFTMAAPFAISAID